MSQLAAELEPPPHDRTTTLAAVAGGDLGEGSLRALRLFFEAAIFTVVGVALARALGAEQPGVLSIFLSAGALGTRAKEILRNSDSQDDLRPARDLMSMFFGISVAYGTATLWLGPAGTESSFSFALKAAGAGPDDLLTRSFPPLLPLLGHNFAVLGAIVVLSVVYRAYGALLSLAWNAAVWGIALTSLTVRAVGSGPPDLYVVAVGFSVLPHLGLEALGYVIGGLSGARIGHQITTSAAFRLPVRAMVASFGALLLASLFEATLPRAIAEWLRTESSRVQSRGPRPIAFGDEVGWEFLHTSGAERVRMTPIETRSPGS